MIRLHHVAGSRSMRVLWLLEELGLDAEIRTWVLGDRAMRGPELRAISPAARVPVLEIDGQSIVESGAIIQYLTETRNALAPRPGEAERARFLSDIHFAETQANLLQELNIQHIFMRPPEARSRPTIKLLTKRLALSAEGLEARLAQQDWLLSRFSAADCMMGFNIDAIFRFLPAADWPALSVYRDRCAARPAYQRALAKGGEGGIYDKEFYGLDDD